VRGCNAFYRQHLVLDAFARFIQISGIDAYLIITTQIGTQDYITSLKSLAQKQNIFSQVRFVEPIPYEQMPLYYNLATSAISFPVSDGMPHSLYESMACGCFHILRALPQYAELIEHTKNGFLVAFDDPERLAQAMQWVIGHPERVQEAGRLNRQKVSQIAEKNQQDKIINNMYGALITRYGSDAT
jgi:glycosyltransferase involved in cell wall biosynthesis